MASNQVTTHMSVDSTGPSLVRFSYNPAKYREILQRQMQHTADRAVDQAVSFTIGDQDGRFLSNFPGRTLLRENSDGAQYHMIGVNRGGDLSVAAP